MENTLENKQAFFAQYYGRKMILYREGFILRDNLGIQHVDEFDKLNLTPLSNISDEDAFEVAKIINKFVYNADTGEGVNYYKEQVLSDPYVLGAATPETVDYLRSKGYALPFRNIDVETLISWCWVKLKTP